MVNSDQWCNGLAVGRQVTQGSARDRARRHLGSCPPDFHVTKVKINAREDKKQRESQAANFKGVFLFYLLNFNQPANWGRCARLMWGGRSECSGGVALFFDPHPAALHLKITLCQSLCRRLRWLLHSDVCIVCNIWTNVQILNRK